MRYGKYDQLLAAFDLCIAIGLFGSCIAIISYGIYCGLVG